MAAYFFWFYHRGNILLKLFWCKGNTWEKFTVAIKDHRKWTKTLGLGNSQLWPGLQWGKLEQAGSLNSVCNPSPWDSSPSRGHPLDWAKPILLPQCHCCQWREMGWCEYGFSNQLEWWTCSFSSASCGRGRMHGFYVAAVCWLCCCAWKAVSEPNSCTVYKWFNFQLKFLLLVSSVSYTDNVKLVPLQCPFFPPYVLFCGAKHFFFKKMVFSNIVCIDCMHLVSIYRSVVRRIFVPHQSQCILTYIYLYLYIYI